MSYKIKKLAGLILELSSIIGLYLSIKENYPPILPISGLLYAAGRGLSDWALEEGLEEKILEHKEDLINRLKDSNQKDENDKIGNI